MLDNRLIEALALVVQEGGFDKAAKALNITQSAVSQRVKLLEELTGQVLLARTTPPQATLAGRKFLKYYLQVRRLEDDLMGEINQTDNKKFTPIALGVNADSLAFINDHSIRFKSAGQWSQRSAYSFQPLLHGVPEFLISGYLPFLLGSLCHPRRENSRSPQPPEWTSPRQDHGNEQER